MRVAILVVILFGTAIGRAAGAQVLEASDAPAFSGVVPIVALSSPAARIGQTKISPSMSSPGLNFPELTASSVLLKATRRAAHRASGAETARRGGVGQGAVVRTEVQRPMTPVPHTLAVNTAASASPGSAVLRAPLTGMRTPQPTRSLGDHLLTGVVAVMLIGYQLRRKHRVLRPHPFTT
jgi:hypothetical protein